MSRPKPLSGFPEFLPAGRIIENRVLDVVRSTFELHGFAPIETRAVEPLGAGGPIGAAAQRGVVVVQPVQVVAGDVGRRLGIAVLQKQGQRLKAGDTVLCFIPESGRFTAGYMLWEVELDANTEQTPEASTLRKSAQSAALPDDALPDVSTIAAPHDPAAAPSQLAPLLTELASIWQDYRSNVWRTPLLQRMRTRQLQITDYLRWMSHWIPQVREGSLWMREGAASLTGDYAQLASLIDLHAGEEQNDFKILHSDYLKAGGTETDIARLRRNPGGEALNAYLHSLAATPNPIGLLGAIYIIEGTGQRIVPSLLPLLRQALPLPPEAFRFLEYHGANDENHLERWLMAVQMALALDSEGTAQQAILQTARNTAAMYLMQFQHVLAE